MSTFSESEFLPLLVTVTNKRSILTTVSVLLNSDQILVIELKVSKNILNIVHKWK